MNGTVKIVISVIQKLKLNIMTTLPTNIKTLEISWTTVWFNVLETFEMSLVARLISSPCVF
ncbi:hypothetical protein D3C71_1777970 [compost metagenome]